MCGASEEIVNHLFVECIFLKDTSGITLKELKIHNVWTREQIDDFFQRWIVKKENREEIPCFICWEVWKHMNQIIFKNVVPSLGRVCTSILQDLGEFKVVQEYNKLRIDRPPILDWDLAVGFFDGASQEMGKKCGAGAIL